MILLLQVNELEGRGSSKRGGFRGFAHYSPYIVVDHAAISRHLNLVKEIVASKKFAVIIPSAVIQGRRSVLYPKCSTL